VIKLGVGHRYRFDYDRCTGCGACFELSTDYMGLALRNPLVASASPLSRTVDGVRRLADASAYGP